MVEEFTDPVLSGYTGDFDKTRRHRLMGHAVSRRVQTIKPRRGIRFPLPVYGILNPDGARVQMVYRAVDLGGRGEREVLTGVRWLLVVSHVRRITLCDRIDRHSCRVSR